MIRRPTQLSLPVPPSWGGRRRGAERKLTPGRRPGVSHHSRALTTPRATRLCLIYVLMNRRKHCTRERGLDPCSSAPWFEGWRDPIAIPHGRPPVVRARTWLAVVGWRRHGLIGLDEQPRS